MPRSSGKVILGVALGLVGAPGSLVAGHSALHKDAEAKAEQLTPASQTGRPLFLVEAQKNYAAAEAALRAEEAELERLHQEEAALRQAAFAKTGSWIEPLDWWRKKQAIKQKISFKKDGVRRARSKLAIAENQAHSMAEGVWSKKHKPSWLGSWWQW